MIGVAQLRAALAPDLRGGSVRVGWVVLVAVIVAAILAPLGGYDPVSDVSAARAGLPPGPHHWLGTDHLGRDTAWRLAWGARAFVGPGLLCAGTTGALGVPLGALAGWLGEPFAGAVRWALGVVASVPSLVLALLAAAIYGSGPVVLAVALGVSAVPALAGTVAARIEEARASEYLLAMRAHGVRGGAILWVHLALGLGGRAVLRAAILSFGRFLALEATLSYLGGFGVREPWPSWGNMLAFEWGRAGIVPLLAPAVALWGALVGVHAAAEAFAEPSDG